MKVNSAIRTGIGMTIATIVAGFCGLVLPKQGLKLANRWTCGAQLT